MNTWIVIPTYNERENLERLVSEIHGQVAATILIIDDNSPDGTGALAEELRVHDDRLLALHRAGKLGLGSAYREGFRYALDHGAEMILQMDADGSHDPAVLPTVLQRLDTADLVLASRYIPGGKFPIVWYRRWISTVGNIYIRLLLGWQIRDWSTGYKGWRRSFLERVMAQPSHGVGYAWLMEMTWIARQLQGRITEVPLVFLERRGGQSKFSWRIAWEDISLAFALARRGTLAKGQKT